MDGSYDELPAGADRVQVPVSLLSDVCEEFHSFLKRPTLLKSDSVMWSILREINWQSDHFVISYTVSFRLY